MKRGHDEEKTNNNKLSRPHKPQQGHGEGEGGGGGENIYISWDLTLNILAKLPVKSLMRFRCVSKLWLSLITDTIKTHQPRLLVTFKDSYKSSTTISSYTYPQNNTKTSFLHKEKETQTEAHDLNYSTVYRYVHGLVCCSSSIRGQLVIYNPTTEQSLTLPQIDQVKYGIRTDDILFGYDPVENKYKVLCFTSKWHHRCYVFTFGGPSKRLQQRCWRRIGCLEGHTSSVTNVCINGILYYIERGVLRRFDVRFERFDQIEMPETLQHIERDFITLVNYQGKLGCIHCVIDGNVDMWIMELDEKREWSKITLSSSLFCLSDSLLLSRRVIAGVTGDGEIVIMPSRWTFAETLYAYFHDPKQNKTRRIVLTTSLELRRKRHIGIRLYTEPDHMENTMSFV